MNRTLENRPPKVLTWHIHGSYLYYLVQSGAEFYLPVKPERTTGYGGAPKEGSLSWPANVHEIPAEEVRSLDLDVVLYQSRQNYLEDQHEILSEEQKKLPAIFLEHDPPRETPTDTRHVVDDENVLLVHVTHFNNLMWDSGKTSTRVIEHGVMVPAGVHYSGEIERGIVVVNGLKTRGRRLGADVFEQLRQEVPLDLVGMQADEMGGLGEVPHTELPAFEARYRFFFNPIRYTSLGLAVCEAMLVGMPVVGLATTEMATVIENGVSGFVDTNPQRLVEAMHHLLKDPQHARRLGEGARQTAIERFHIDRFKKDWDETFAQVTGRNSKLHPVPNATALAQKHKQG